MIKICKENLCKSHVSSHSKNVIRNYGKKSWVSSWKYILWFLSRNIQTWIVWSVNSFTIFLKDAICWLKHLKIINMGQHIWNDRTSMLQHNKIKLLLKFSKLQCFLSASCPKSLGFSWSTRNVQTIPGIPGTS